MPIQDAIHGYIYLNELEEEVLDTPQMQRLRRIKQLGFTYLVYPSATHTRFEHSLGAMHLAGQFADSLGLNEDDTQRIRLAALLHDVGHGPFSHTTEVFLQDAGHSHEEFSRRAIQETEISRIITDHGFDPDTICALVNGDTRLGSSIAGHIDVDRMDYLMRDAYYTGVAYGTIDAETIIRSARLHDNQIVFDEKYISALEGLLTARHMMRKPVYLHRTSLVADRMLQHAVHQYRKASGVPIEELAALDEPGLLSRLRNTLESAEMMERIDNRDLYKIASYTTPDQDPDTLAERLRDATGLPSDTILAQKITYNRSAPYDVPIKTEDGTRPLSTVSELLSALQQLPQRSEVRVYTPPKHCEQVAAAMDA